MKRISIYSIRFRMMAFTAFLLVSISVVLFYNNFSAIQMIREKVYDALESTIRMYQNQLNDQLQSTETYLATFAYDSENIQNIETSSRSSSKWFSAAYHIQKNFDTSLPTYSVDSFFYYYPDGKSYIANTKNNNTPNTMLSKIQAVICDKMDNHVFISKKNAGKWFPLKVEQQYYLFRVIRVQNSYIGAWISTEHALEPLIGGDVIMSDIFFLSDQGLVLSSNVPIKVLPSPKSTDSDSFTEVKGKNLMITEKAEFGDLYLTAMVSNKQLSSGINGYIPVILLVLVSMVLISGFFSIAIQQWIVRPVTRLSGAILELRNGNLNTAVKLEPSCEEFREVGISFNEMVQEIKSLKIGVYEERLSKQQVQLQYLKAQIAPHFLINCLNTIYQLTDTNRYDLTRIMIQDLSHHLRYTLSSGKTVSLQQEIIHVENYIELSQIRYPNSLVLVTDYAPNTLSATAIPLLILNFVENTVKYEAVIGKTLEIHISSSLLDENGQTYVKICIWDTGGGFSADILERIQDLPQFIQDNKERHIGISNVFQRANILLKDCDFRFSNRSGAGAQIDIKIPYIPFESPQEIFASSRKEPPEV